MEISFRNKIALVTGGASGMGESMCYALAREGASIIVVDKNLDSANAVVSNLERNGGRAISIKTDVRSTEDLDKMANIAMDTFGKINILIKKMSLDFGIKEETIDKFIKDDKIQDQILEERIAAQKNYKISSTPTIYINDKKYDGKHNYRQFKKEIERLL